MFIRFITTFTNAYDEKETGVFQALGYLRRDIHTSADDVEALLALRDWFDIHLNPPTQFTKRKSHKETGTAISWYRDSAGEYIAKMFEMAQIFEKYGIIVSVVKREDRDKVL